MNYYIGEAKFYSDEECQEKYLVFAESYEEAAQKLVRYYGENELTEFFIAAYAEGDVLPLSENGFDELKKTEQW